MCLTFLVAVWMVGVARALRCSEFVRSWDPYECEEETPLLLWNSREWTTFKVTTKGTRQSLLMQVRRLLDPGLGIQVREQKRVTKQLNSPHIVKFLFEHSVGSFSVQVFDPAGLQPLPSVLQGQTRASLRPISLKVATAVASLLQEMHKNEWVANDLRIEDVLTAKDKADSVLVLSLEEATPLKTMRPSNTDFHYWEPHRWGLSGSRLDESLEAADHYSLGVIMFMMIHRSQFPFPGKSKEEVRKKVETGKYRVSKGCSIEYALVLADLLLAEREKRPPMSVVIELLQLIPRLKQPRHLEEPLFLNTYSRGTTLTSLADPEFLSAYEILMDDYRRKVEKDRTVKAPLLDRMLPTTISRKIVVVLAVGLVILGVGMTAFFRSTPPERPEGSGLIVPVTSPIRVR